MPEDLYAVLGVPRTATGEEIRRRYRELAKELHPDVNPSQNAEERFKNIARAFETLGDTQKRQAYDRGDFRANGAAHARSGQRPAGASGQAQWRYGAGTFDDDPFEDIFASFRRPSSRAKTSRGPDQRFTLEVDLEDIVSGATKRFSLPGGETLEVVVPIGVQDGQTLRLRGKGLPGRDKSERGDALIEVTVRPHPRFKRQGNDLTCDCPLTIDEAILGGRIEITTLTGRISLSIPKGTSSGKVFRLRGQGLGDPGTGQRGDLMVTTRIVLPGTIDGSLEDFIAAWGQSHRYDPGKR